MDVGDDGLGVLVRHGDGNHGRARTSVLDDRQDELALLVAEDECGPQQIHAAQLSPARVGTVAGAAETGVVRFAPFEDFRRYGRALLRRERRRTFFTALSVHGRRRRRLCRLLRIGRLLRISGLLRRGRGRRLSGGVLMTRARCQTDADDQSQTH